MKTLGRSAFTDWDVSLGDGNIQVTGKWVGAPRCPVALTEHPGQDPRTLLLHLDAVESGSPSARVTFQTLADADTFNVVAIQFPNEEFERIYLPNYDLHDEPE